MSTIIKNTVTFKVVERTSDSIHEFEAIKRYDKVDKKLVLDRTPSSWFVDKDGIASEAVATNETHALIAIFGTVSVPQTPEEPTL